jgi:DNA-binding NarL/FixJ family response regulator
LEKPTVRVLVVDDYKPWRNFVLSRLERWPRLQVVGEASDGREAVEKSLELQADLIVLDIGLPNVNGIEVARQILQKLPNARILFCSENRSPEVAGEALRAGGAGYLLKSDAGRELPAAVTSMIWGKRFVSRAFSGHAFPEASDSGLVRDHRHVVQFYMDDVVLLDELAALLTSAVGQGRSVAVIVTPSHRIGLEKRLLGHGGKVSEATLNGRFCMLDADQTLSEFMDPTGPSRERFLSQFEKILRTLTAASAAADGEVLLFGEMVAVLWAQTRYDAAIRLEELWNELALTSSFDLYCAYPAEGFRGELPGGGYADICAQHSHVVSAFGEVRSPS